MWYNNEVGKEFKCTLKNSEHTLFNPYTDYSHSFETLDKINKQITAKHTIIEQSLGYKIILNSNPILEDIKLNGWILREDAEIIAEFD